MACSGTVLFNLVNGQYVGTNPAGTQFSINPNPTNNPAAWVLTVTLPSGSTQYLPQSGATASSLTYPAVQIECGVVPITISSNLGPCLSSSSSVSGSSGSDVIYLTNPLNNDTVSGIVLPAAFATSPAGISFVEIFQRLNGTSTWFPIGTDSSLPYQVSWNTTIIPNGLYDLMATETNLLGGQLSSTIITVTVSNSGSSASSPIQLVQSEAAGRAGTGTVTAFWNNPTTDKNFLVAVFGSQNAYDPAFIPAGWTEATHQEGDGGCVYIAYKENAAVQASVVFGGAGTTNGLLVVAEYSGIRTSGSLDQVASNNQTGTTIGSGTTAATGQANELAIAGFFAVASQSSPTSVSNGFSEIQAIGNAGADGLEMDDKILSSTGAQSTDATYAASVAVDAAIATFKGY